MFVPLDLMANTFQAEEV